MTTKRDAEIKEPLTREQKERRSAVTRMLEERELRQKLSSKEVRRMRGEGRY